MDGTEAEATKTRLRYTPGEILRILEMEIDGRSRDDIARLHERLVTGISGLIDDLLAERRTCPDEAKAALEKLKAQIAAKKAAKTEKAAAGKGRRICDAV